MERHIVLFKSAEPAALVGWGGVTEFKASLTFSCFYFSTDVGTESFSAGVYGRLAVPAAVVCLRGEVGSGNKGSRMGSRCEYGVCIARMFCGIFGF